MPSNDFFLDPDEAQTFGDINYMRKSKKVRRTFPKTLKNPDGFAIERSVSSGKEENLTGIPQKIQPVSNGYQAPSYQAPAPAPAPAPVASTPAPAPAPAPVASTPAPAPKQADSGMDMFRNMAKNIRSGR